MRILLDHNTPAPLRYALGGHQVETAYERGWAELLNGHLIDEAETAGFDLMITTDRGIRYQQNAVPSMQPSAFAELEIPRNE